MQWAAPANGSCGLSFNGQPLSIGVPLVPPSPAVVLPVVVAVVNVSLAARAWAAGGGAGSATVPPGLLTGDVYTVEVAWAAQADGAAGGAVMPATPAGSSGGTGAVGALLATSTSRATVARGQSGGSVLKRLRGTLRIYLNASAVRNATRRFVAQGESTPALVSAYALPSLRVRPDGSAGAPPYNTTVSVALVRVASVHNASAPYTSGDDVSVVLHSNSRAAHITVVGKQDDDNGAWGRAATGWLGGCKLSLCVCSRIGCSVRCARARARVCVCEGRRAAVGLKVADACARGLARVIATAAPLRPHWQACAALHGEQP